MKSVNKLSNNQFLRLFFTCISFCFLIAAVLMPDRSSMLTGLWQIMSQPSKVATNYFAVGGYAATFLNSGLVSLLCVGLFCLPKSEPNQKSILAFLLVIGFTGWGINLLNILPSIIGVFLYCLIKHEAPGKQVNAMFFSTGAAPIITDLFIRYPYQEVVGFTWYGILLGSIVGLLIGLCMPAGIAHSGKVHKDYDLYSAALPLGLISFMLQAVFYNALGLAIPQVPDPATLQVASPVIVNSFCLIVFVAAILCGRFLWKCSWKQYWTLMTAENYQADYLKLYGPGPLLINMGLLGSCILLYYNLIGIPMNGITFGCIFCVVSCCGCGSNPLTVLPIMLGYVAASFGMGAISQALGGNYQNILYAQPIAVGLCFATGLSPVSGRYGLLAGMIAAALHLCMVTVLPSLHGGFCLYNGGFTAALVCLMIVPQLERFCKTRTERKALRAVR